MGRLVGQAYAYVLGNPLSYTDSSGEFIDPGDNPFCNGAGDGWIDAENDSPCFGGGWDGPGINIAITSPGGGGVRGPSTPSTGTHNPLPTRLPNSPAAPTSTPAPPVTTPAPTGSETLGLPPGVSIPGPLSIGTDPFALSFCRMNDWDCGELGALGWWQKVGLRAALLDAQILYRLLKATGGIKVTSLSLGLNLRGFVGQSAWADLDPEQRIEAWEQYFNQRAANSGWSVQVNAEEDYVEFTGVREEGIKVMRGTGEVFRTTNGGPWTSIIGPWEP